MQTYKILFKQSMFSKSIAVFECFDFEFAYSMLEDFRKSTPEGTFKIKIIEGEL